MHSSFSSLTQGQEFESHIFLAPFVCKFGYLRQYSFHYRRISPKPFRLCVQLHVKLLQS